MSTNMSNCVAYIQLFVNWIVLCLATLGLCLVHESAVFFGFSQSLDDLENVVIYGFWVLAEVGAFFLLLVLATCIMCGSKRVPPGPGFIHLVVDPSLVTLVAVPLLLIRGLPTASTLAACTRWHVVNDNVTATPPGDCQEYFPLYQSLYQENQANGVMTKDIGDHLQRQLKQWLSCLQCAITLPPLLRLLRYRWKMAWQPYIQSSLYLYVQALEIAAMVDTSALRMGTTASLLSKAGLYVAFLSLCVGGMALATPPMYLGNHITNNYLKALMVVGTITTDLPFLAIRGTLLTAHHTPSMGMTTPTAASPGSAAAASSEAKSDVLSVLSADTISEIGTWVRQTSWHPHSGVGPNDDIMDSMFYILTVKDLVCALGLLVFCVKSSQCVRTQYRSLRTAEHDVEDLFGDEEDFV